MNLNPLKTKLGTSSQYLGTLYLACCLLLIAANQSVFADLAIESLLKPEPKLWDHTPQSFIKEHAEHGFKWTSKQTDAARAYKAPITFLQMPVWEAILRFSTDRPNKLSLSLYNRGDAGDLDRPTFSSKFQNVRMKISQWTKCRTLRRKHQKDKRSRRQIEQWRTQDCDISLFGSYSTKDARGHPTFRAEYIRVDITPRIRKDQTSRSFEKSSTSNTRKVVRSKNDGVYLEGVPMVDQGEKGYCSVATAERVFRYYGFETDQHELAQLASSSASRGTSSKVMLAALKAAGRKMGWRVKTIENFEWRDFENLVRQYNRLAKRQNKRKLYLDTTDPNVWSKTYKQMDLALLRQARLKSAQDYRRFQSTIAGYINQGKPLAWSVMLGKVPEEPPVSSNGAHMRLITGYHPKKRLVYYSDSWGAGHEHKNMRFDNAWAITKGLYLIEPK